MFCIFQSHHNLFILCIVNQELNSAGEFISLYEELMPVVQTLPQVLLHKEMIVSKLLCRVHMQAKLSLEPILRYGDMILLDVFSRTIRYLAIYLGLAFLSPLMAEYMFTI